AKKLKSLDVNVLYYVAPQAWVWKPWRSKVLEKNVHTLFTILPFEKKWFGDRGVSKVKAVVHPLINEYGAKLNSIRERKAADFKARPLKLLLLPGSRNVEVETLLPIFAEGTKLIQDVKDIELGIVKSESVRPEHYNTDLKFAHVWDSQDLPQALNWCDISIAASGTVTLATGLFQVPTVVCYKVSLFTEFILSLLIPYEGPVSLTNIIHGEYVFPELIQYKSDRYGIFKHTKEWIFKPEIYDSIVNKLKTTQTLLTGDDFSVPEYMSDVINQGK
ncbi:MAG: hypothetical protein OEW87_12810, partial [Flavobacteriaceae bacterium]|nr:hypothetical protein [Flavobacteriaceae bacterium]